MTALRPGQSPPAVRMPIRLELDMCSLRQVAEFIGERQQRRLLRRVPQCRSPRRDLVSVEHYDLLTTPGHTRTITGLSGIERGNLSSVSLSYNRDEGSGRPCVCIKTGQGF